MAPPRASLKRVAGRFYRAIPVDRLAAVLDPPGPDSAGRYHRPGQPALYITPGADWATIAIGQYLLADGKPRVIVPVDLDEAFVLDQHNADACAALGIDRDASNQSWSAAVREGREPPSWRSADMARQAGADGIIDRSRGIAGGWHVTLFRWNQAGAPQVSVAGEPLPCDFPAARSRWPAPPGWHGPK